MMYPHNHERPAMASEFFQEIDEAARAQRAAAQEAPRPRPLDESAAGAHPSGPPPPNPADFIPSGARCKVKGCVYPATEVEAGMCLCHANMEDEPQFFHTRQPSLRLLEAGIYGMTTEDEDFRIRLLENRIALRKIFLKGVA
jgi:hypothetical protein